MELNCKWNFVGRSFDIVSITRFRFKKSKHDNSAEFLYFTIIYVHFHLDVEDCHCSSTHSPKKEEKFPSSFQMYRVQFLPFERQQNKNHKKFMKHLQNEMAYHMVNKSIDLQEMLFTSLLSNECRKKLEYFEFRRRDPRRGKNARKTHFQVIFLLAVWMTFLYPSNAQQTYHFVAGITPFVVSTVRARFTCTFNLIENEKSSNNTECVPHTTSIF